MPGQTALFPVHPLHGCQTKASSSWMEEEGLQHQTMVNCTLFSMTPALMA